MNLVYPGQSGGLVAFHPKVATDGGAIQRKQGLPGVTGAIDGSLVHIQRPDDYEGFYCRKCYPAINVQATVDADLKFMSVDLFSGSWSDKEMWEFAPSSHQYCAKMPI
ncbi:unnamed protein product [Phytophthora fragariaefolia]|uniref:Unnamed protein product n=1 Tax=Phytophthora fragariaefolia TaxID=1490495 RepID=A0A9W6Y2M0_9STRA|nr:unnamed protein product [Phytophthora fragariaefolia]